ncbi:MAG: CPBP family intramembrane metalloprotease [Acidobacteriaceae bacterium]|nr:CPBP family intramembrane metalloprotease [Acidobacteriaceae bacterium]
MSRAALWVEFLVLFVGLPLGYRFSSRPIPALPLLWLAALYCYWQLRRDPTFSRALLWNPKPAFGQLASILICFVIVAAIVWFAVRLIAPALLFDFVRTRPVFWALVMVLYPVLSVYPQGMIYRSFLMHRYAPILPPGTAMILVSAAAFAFMHIIFRNPLAVALTFAGGILFAWRYWVAESLFTSSLEHALYGCWLFTVGLGQYFYHGRIALK